MPYLPYIHFVYPEALKNKNVLIFQWSVSAIKW